jgi:hypothetical protein
MAQARLRISLSTSLSFDVHDWNVQQRGEAQSDWPSPIKMTQKIQGKKKETLSPDFEDTIAISGAAGIDLVGRQIHDGFSSG